MVREVTAFEPGPEGFPAFWAALDLPPLEDFQRLIVATVYGPDPESLILVPKGNAKTTLMAVVALHHLLTVPRAAVFCGAATVAQANLLREIAADLAAHPAVAEHLKVTKLEVRSAEGGARLRMVPSDGPRSQGITYSLAICDELHAHRDDALYLSLRSALAKRPGARMVTISTADTGLERPLSRLRARALDAPHVERTGALTRCSGDGLAALLWECDRDVDLDDLEAVAEANPASWITPEALALQRKALPDGPFARFHANAPDTRPEGAWLPAGAWAAATGEPTFRPGEKIVCGVDVGSGRSTTAVAWVGEEHDDGTRHLGVAVYTGDEGVALALDKVRELARTYTLRECVADPWHWDLADLELRREGVLSIKFPQTDVRMVPASQKLRDAVVDRRLVLPPDRALAQQAAGAIQAHSRRGWRLERASRSPEHAIDAVVAAAMAWERATRTVRQARRLGYLNLA